MDAASLSQLMDMGVPRARARAALARCKGDVMTAAERVFEGDFDNVPSDDEGVNEPSLGLMTPAETPHPAAASERGYDDEDEDEDMDFDGFQQAEEDTVQIQSDPYAGIFFSKDRVEEVIETIDPVQTTKITLPGPKKVELSILGRGAWMSGCPEGNEQSHLFQLYNTLEEKLSCPNGCGTVCKRDPSQFLIMFNDFSSYVNYLRYHIRSECPKCHVSLCLACGEPSKPSQSSTASSIGNGKQPVQANAEGEYDELLHCYPLQGIIVGVGLHIISKSFHSREANSSGSSSSVAPPAKKQKVAAQLPNSTDDDDDDDDEDDDDEDEWGYPMGKRPKSFAHGTGYAGSLKEDTSGQLAAEELQRKVDEGTAKMLASVRIYLPSQNRPSGPRPSDWMVHPTALAHLRRTSSFVSDLLRNDSLLDMTKRGTVYRALFDWLEVISSHESLASMLGMPQMRPVKSLVSPTDPAQRFVTYEGAASPRELLESCVIQAKAALKGLKATTAVQVDEPDPVDEEERLRMTAEEWEAKQTKKAKNNDAQNAELEAFCERIITCAERIDKRLVETKGQDFVTRMRETLPKLPEMGEPTHDAPEIKKESETEVKKIYEDWATHVRFQYCDMSNPGGESYRHAFSSSITSLSDQNLPRRSMAIAKELAILTRNLPVAWHSSIFLRVDEARVDCIKAMIIGPEGTPYQNGCFIFDIFLPLDYNKTPPNVKIVTTNGGKFRYNPNLYNDGKVCLSLLGTWQGPGWISGQSTLLQVLVSIQSLIFSEEPYLNEPGWANSGGTPQSKAYSANCRRMTLEDAMGNNLKNPPAPFENEIRTHFRLKSKAIKAQLEEWKAIDDGISTSPEAGYGGIMAPSPAAGAKTGAGSKAVAKETHFDKLAKRLIGLLDQVVSGEVEAEV